MRNRTVIVGAAVAEAGTAHVLRSEGYSADAALADAKTDPLHDRPSFSGRLDDASPDTVRLLLGQAADALTIGCVRGTGATGAGAR